MVFRPNSSNRNPTKDFVFFGWFGKGCVVKNREQRTKKKQSIAVQKKLQSLFSQKKISS